MSMMNDNNDDDNVIEQRLYSYRHYHRGGQKLSSVVSALKFEHQNRNVQRTYDDDDDDDDDDDYVNGTQKQRQETTSTLSLDRRASNKRQQHVSDDVILFVLGCFIVIVFAMTFVTVAIILVGRINSQSMMTQSQSNLFPSRSSSYSNTRTFERTSSKLVMPSIHANVLATSTTTRATIESRNLQRDQQPPQQTSSNSSTSGAGDAKEQKDEKTETSANSKGDPNQTANEGATANNTQTDATNVEKEAKDEGKKGADNSASTDTTTGTDTGTTDTSNSSTTSETGGSSSIYTNGTATTSTKELPLWFSVWFPTYNNEDATDTSNGNTIHDILDQLIDPENPIRQMVLSSFAALLCQETDVTVVDDWGGSNDICPTLASLPTDSASRHRRQQQQQQHVYSALRMQKQRILDDSNVTTTDDVQSDDQTGTDDQSLYSRSIVLNEPSVTIRIRREHNESAYASTSTVPLNVTLAWTVWTVTYPVLKIGELYIEETQMNSDSASDVNATSSLNTMKEVVQLAIDVNLIDGTLDAILEQNTAISRRSIKSLGQEMPPSHSCPIRLEWKTFFPLYLSEYVTQPFIVRGMYPMRLAGIILFFFSIVAPLSLTHLGNRRRRRINEMEENRIKFIDTGNAEIIVCDDNDDCDNDGSNNHDGLKSNRGVEQMLNQSSGRFRYVPTGESSASAIIQSRSISGSVGESEMPTILMSAKTSSSNNYLGGIVVVPPTQPPPNTGKVAMSILHEHEVAEKKMLLLMRQQQQQQQQQANGW